MSDAPSPNRCESCVHYLVCQDILVLREVLKEEARYLPKGSFAQRIDEVLKLLDETMFSYPYATVMCSLAREPDLAERLVASMQSILAELRAAQAWNR